MENEINAWGAHMWRLTSGTMQLSMRLFNLLMHFFFTEIQLNLVEICLPKMVIALGSALWLLYSRLENEKDIQAPHFLFPHQIDLCAAIVLNNVRILHTAFFIDVFFCCFVIIYIYKCSREYIFVKAQSVHISSKEN